MPTVGTAKRRPRAESSFHKIQPVCVLLSQRHRRLRHWISEVSTHPAVLGLQRVARLDCQREQSQLRCANRSSAAGCGLRCIRRHPPHLEVSAQCGCVFRPDRTAASHSPSETTSPTARSLRFVAKVVSIMNRVQLNRFSRQGLDSPTEFLPVIIPTGHSSTICVA